MLPLSLLRKDPKWIKSRLQIKQYKHLDYIDKILLEDKKKRSFQLKRDALAHELKLRAQQIGKIISTHQQEEVNTLKTSVSKLKQKLQDLDQCIEDLSKTIYNLLVEIPNIPLEDVPEGKHAIDNEIIRQSDVQQSEKTKPLAHWDICEKYELVNFEKGNLITGSGFPVYKHHGALLQRKLIDYFLDENRKAGYTEYHLPLLVNEGSVFATGQLPDKDSQMYHIREDNLFLIPTSEVPLTNMYRDKIISMSDLPIKITGYTPCFRREAGSYGKDVRGLNRLHQFDKVEIVQIVEPQHSRDTLNEMVAHVEKLIQSLKLPYRILKLCGGDTSFTSALTYDFEVYSITQKQWLEVSSVSHFLSFQSNRLNLRYKNKEKKNELLHTLNGSSLALPRIVAALLEFYQVKEGVKTPDALLPYLKNEFIVRNTNN